MLRFKHVGGDRLKVFLVIWKTWKHHRVLMFNETYDVWKYIQTHKIESYTVYWADRSIDYSGSTTSIRERIQRLIKENPEVLVNWNPTVSTQ